MSFASIKATNNGKIGSGREILTFHLRPVGDNRIFVAMHSDKSDIAAAYDEARELTPARQRHWRDLLAAHVDRSTISLIVDLGCGTGRFSEILGAEFGARIIGIDPSAKMIEQARLRPTTGMIEFKRASAEQLPLAGGCVDLVFMSQVYHHFPDPVAVAQECRRILHTGGYVCVRTATRENDVVIPRFFPAVVPCLTPIYRPPMTSVQTSLRPASALSIMQSSRKSWHRAGRNSYESPPFEPTPS